MLVNTRITRTCGGDPDVEYPLLVPIIVLPAHAGVILITDEPINNIPSITRTCGGDPNFSHYFNLLYASITRTCGGDPEQVVTVRVSEEYYPHMRG